MCTKTHYGTLKGRLSFCKVCMCIRVLQASLDFIPDSPNVLNWVKRCHKYHFSMKIESYDQILSKKSFNLNIDHLMKWKYSMLYCKHLISCSLYQYNAIRKQVFGRIFRLAWPINKKRNQINQKRNESGNQLLFSPTKCSFFCSFFLGLHRINFYFHFFGKAYNFSPAFSNNVFVLLLLLTSSHQSNYASRCNPHLPSFSDFKHIPSIIQF